VTWRVVGDVQIERRAWNRPLRPIAGEELRHVANPHTESLTLLIAHKMPVLFHQCPAARAVHYDRLIAVAECCDIHPRQRPRFFQQSRVRMQGAAANLARDLVDVIPIHNESPDCRVGNMGEQALQDAASEQQAGWAVWRLGGSTAAASSRRTA